MPGRGREGGGRNTTTRGYTIHARVFDTQKDGKSRNIQKGVLLTARLAQCGNSSISIPGSIWVGRGGFDPRLWHFFKNHIVYRVPITQ